MQRFQASKNRKLKKTDYRIKHSLLLNQIFPIVTDVVVQKQVGVLSALPPLKVRNTGSEVPVSDSSNGYEEMKNDEQEVIDIQSETNNDEVHVPEKELIDDFDTKSNTESTMILEEVENQEQQHQPDVPVEINAFEPEITNNDNINEDVRSPEVDSDVIVHKEQSRISKLFNVFRKKRSVSAVVIDNTVTKTHEGKSFIWWENDFNCN